MVAAPMSPECNVYKDDYQALETVSHSASVIGWREQRFAILLDTARRLRDQDYPAPAVVMAQTACEVCMEVVLTDVLRERVHDHDIADFITGSLRNYNPKTDNVKKLYELLFGDRVQGASFWPSFLEHVKRRNNIVHRGQAATPQDADESIVAVDKVIRHLLQKRA
jgi:hypothetical protein